MSLQASKQLRPPMRACTIDTEFFYLSEILQHKNRTKVIFVGFSPQKNWSIFIGPHASDGNQGVYIVVLPFFLLFATSCTNTTPAPCTTPPGAAPKAWSSSLPNLLHYPCVRLIFFTCGIDTLYLIG
jgi:hypothetical protein